MRRRILSLLILIAIFFGIYYFFYYFFVLNKGNLTIISNVPDYKVTMYVDKLKTSFSADCKNKKCELVDIAPFSYEITIEKKGYKAYKTNLKIQSRSTLKLEVYLEKQISIKKVESFSENKQTEKAKKLDRFREISRLQKSYKYFNLGELGHFYFVKNSDGTIDLFNKRDEKEEKIMSFYNISQDKLDVQKVFSADDLILIVYGNDKNIYNLKTGTVLKIFFPQNVKYVKKYFNLYYLVNDKGTFVYDSKTQKIEYFYMFKDFVNYDSQNYLGVIYGNEKNKKRNYNLEENDKNLIIKYNFITKNIKVLEATYQDISKIVWEDGKIYFYDDDGGKYLVENVE